MDTRKNIRLNEYDYSKSGAYFITICIENKKCILSKIVETDSNCTYVELTEIGFIVQNAICSISKYYSTIRIDKFVIMPNYIHLILCIENAEFGRPMTAPTISMVVNQLKGFVTKTLGFKIWQKSFYDHIIRDEKDYIKIFKYIENNPLKWELDKYYSY
jgi:REP element-mobilizing transposase RayT